jgi:hypothetical protein
MIVHRRAMLRWILLLVTAAACYSFSSTIGKAAVSRQHLEQTCCRQHQETAYNLYRRRGWTNVLSTRDRPPPLHTSITVCQMVKRVPRTEVDGQASPRQASTSRQRPRRSDSPSTERGDKPPFVPQRAPHQFDHRQEQARPFIDVASEIEKQRPNEDAPLLTLPAATTFSLAGTTPQRIEHSHIETYSLNALFPGLNMSELFASSTNFRSALRDAIRADMFDTTPSYHNLSEKARRVLLLPDTSLQGSWRCKSLPGQGRLWAREGDDGTVDSDDATTAAAATDSDATTSPPRRMTRLSQVLCEYLGPTAPNGDDFMDTIGSLCGNDSSAVTTHWMDIVGVLNRRVPHSWHQDTGTSPAHSRTVLLGFPPVDNYDGVGVFSHVIKLSHEQWKASAVEDDAVDQPPGRQLDQPIVYSNEDLQLHDSLEEFIVRPRFAMGREIIAYRDVDVLHSSPDVAYRMSLMRFM